MRLRKAPPVRPFLAHGNPVPAIPRHHRMTDRQTGRQTVALTHNHPISLVACLLADQKVRITSLLESLVIHIIGVMIDAAYQILVLLNDARVALVFALEPLANK